MVEFVTDWAHEEQVIPSRMNLASILVVLISMGFAAVGIVAYDTVGVEILIVFRIDIKAFSVELL